jgi:uncharacterized protein with PQ loop repeat
MSLSSFLGLLGTFIGLVRALPQLIGLLRAQKAWGGSVDTAATSAVVSSGWAAYGLLTRQPYVALATGASAIVFLMVTVFAVRFGRSLRELKIAPVWFCVLILAAMAKAEQGLGIILPVSVLAANLPQLRVAYKEDNLSDLSLGTWLLSMSDGLVWGAYSLICHDMAIMVFAFFQMVTSGLIVAFKRTHKAKLHRKRLYGASKTGE